MFPLDRTSFFYFTLRLSRHLLVSGVLFLLYLIYHTSYPLSTCFLIFFKFYFFFLYIVYISYIFLNIQSFLLPRLFFNVLDKHLVKPGTCQTTEHTAQNNRRRYCPTIQPDSKGYSKNRADRRNILIIYILDPLFHNIAHAEADSNDNKNKIFWKKSQIHT